MLRISKVASRDALEPVDTTPLSIWRRDRKGPLIVVRSRSLSGKGSDPESGLRPAQAVRGRRTITASSDRVRAAIKLPAGFWPCGGAREKSARGETARRKDRII